MRSIANLLSLSGGSHGNSSRNTSEYSHTTGTSKSVFSSTPSRLYTCGTSQDFKGSTSTFFPMGCSRVTSRGEQEMTPLCLVNQSIPRITSIPSDFNTVRSAMKGIPWIIILTPLHSKIHLRSPRGELVTMGWLLMVMGREFCETNLVET